MSEIISMAVFEIKEGENGEKIYTLQDNDDQEEILGKLVDNLINKMRGKKVSLNKTSNSRAFILKDASQQASLEAAIGANSDAELAAVAEKFVRNYILSPKSRRGLFIVVNASVQHRKQINPRLFCFKVDYTSSLSMVNGEWVRSDETLILDLKKAFQYPVFDGIDYHFDEIHFVQGKNDYFHRMFLTDHAQDMEEIYEDILFELLGENYAKYFNLPEEDRKVKREIAGPSRIALDDDQQVNDNIAHLSKKLQIEIVDKVNKAHVTKINVGSGIKLEFKTDLFGSDVLMGHLGLEKVLILKAHRIEAKGPFLPIEFLKHAPVEEVITDIGLEPVTLHEKEMEA